MIFTAYKIPIVQKNTFIISPDIPKIFCYCAVITDNKNETPAITVSIVT